SGARGSSSASIPLAPPLGLSSGPWTSALRAAALRPWLAEYDHRRPHRALGMVPPMARLAADENNVLGNHSQAAERRTARASASAAAAASPVVIGVGSGTAYGATSPVTRV